MRDLSEKAIHPGDVLGEVYMKPVQPPITVHDLADSLGISPQELTDFIEGRRSVTMSLAARLAVRFRTTTVYWLGLQALYDKQSQTAKFGRVRRLSAKRLGR